jgi:hypothetical protein
MGHFKGKSAGLQSIRADVKHNAPRIFDRIDKSTAQL